MPPTLTAEQQAEAFDADTEAVIAAAVEQISEMFSGPELADQVRPLIAAHVDEVLAPVLGDAEAAAGRLAELEAAVRDVGRRHASPPPGSTGRTVAQRFGGDPHAANPHAAGAALDGAFDTMGDFVDAVLALGARHQPSRDERLVLIPEQGEVRGDMIGEDLSDGGALVPEEFRPLMMPSPLQPATIRGRAMVVPMSSATIDIPYVTDYDHSDGTVYGGITVEWLEAGDEFIESQPAFAQLRLTAKALAGGTELQNTLIADSRPAIMTMLSEWFPAALRWKEERDFLRGNGAGKPLGIIGHDATISIDRDGSSSTIITKGDVDAMVSRLMPAAQSRAVWYAHPFMAQHLSALQTGGTQYERADITDPLPMIVAGRPVFFNEHCSYPGTAGDFILTDWMGYVIGDRQAVSIAASPHVEFRKNATVLRVISRLDGQPLMQKPMSLAQGPSGDPDGATVSCFITLDDA